MSYTRQQKQTASAGIAVGATEEIRINADWFEVRQCYRLSDSANVEIEMAVDSDVFAAVEQGDEGGNPTPTLKGTQIKILKFKNTSASTVFVRVLYGLGLKTGTSRTVISNPTLAMSAATITALRALRTATPAATDISGTTATSGSLGTNFCLFSIYCSAGVITCGGVPVPVGGTFDFPAPSGAQFSNPAYDASAGTGILLKMTIA